MRTEDNVKPVRLSGSPIPARTAELMTIGIAVISMLNYSAGLIIVSVHLQRYGLRVFDLIRTEYILVGGMWLFLTCLTIALLATLEKAIRSIWKEPKGLAYRVSLRRAQDKADLFDALEKIPTYVLDNTRRQANTRRLLSLARKLTIDGIDADAWPEAKTLAVETLRSESARLRENPDFTEKVSGKAKINIKEFKVEFGELLEMKESRIIAVEVTSENIDDLFAQCETILGEGLKDEFWRRVHDLDDPDRAKLELFCILQDPAAVRSVQEECGKRIDKLFEQFRDKIEELPSSRREQYALIGRQGADPRPEKIHAPDLIEVRKEKPLWNDHLFVNQSGKFGWQANTWEDMILREEMEGKTFAGWLRNIPRKHWALCVPYGRGQAKPVYPDILVFRREGKKIKIDILDPHDDERADAAEKAVGLADFARKHGAVFGRIEMIRIVKGQIQRLRLHQESVRDKVLRVSDLKHLAELYEQHG